MKTRGTIRDVTLNIRRQYMVSLPNADGQEDTVVVLEFTVESHMFGLGLGLRPSRISHMFNSICLKVCDKRFSSIFVGI